MTTLFADGIDMAERRVAFGGTGHEPEEGTREWLLLTRDRLKSVMNELHSRHAYARGLFDQMRSSGTWKLLSNPKTKRPFKSFNEFCSGSVGFGRTEEEIERRLVEARTAATQAKLEAKTIRQGTRTDLADHRAVGTKLGRGSNSAPHILRRLAVKHPGILAAYERGEFRSARAAGIAAGIVRPPSWEAQVLALWKRGTPEERAAVYPKLKLKDVT